MGSSDKYSDDSGLRGSRCAAKTAQIMTASSCGDNYDNDDSNSSVRDGRYAAMEVDHVQETASMPPLWALWVTWNNSQDNPQLYTINEEKTWDTKDLKKLLKDATSFTSFADNTTYSDIYVVKICDGVNLNLPAQLCRFRIKLIDTRFSHFGDHEYYLELDNNLALFMERILQPDSFLVVTDGVFIITERTLRIGVDDEGRHPGSLYYFTHNAMGRPRLITHPLGNRIDTDVYDHNCYSKTESNTNFTVLKVIPKIQRRELQPSSTITVQDSTCPVPSSSNLGAIISSSSRGGNKCQDSEPPQVNVTNPLPRVPSTAGSPPRRRRAPQRTPLKNLPGGAFRQERDERSQLQAKPCIAVLEARKQKRAESPGSMWKAARYDPRDSGYEYQLLSALYQQLYRITDPTNRRMIGSTTNVFGVVDGVFIPYRPGSYRIRISDETMSGVLVRIHPSAKFPDMGPVIQPGDIIRIHRVTVQEEFGGQTNESGGSGVREMVISTAPMRNFSLFDYSPDINKEIKIATLAQTITICEKDQKRVRELRKFISSRARYGNNVVSAEFPTSPARPHPPKSSSNESSKGEAPDPCPSSSNSFVTAPGSQDWLRHDTMDEIMAGISSQAEVRPDQEPSTSTQRKGAIIFW